jgi:hypothetical protein
MERKDFLIKALVLMLVLSGTVNVFQMVWAGHEAFYTQLGHQYVHQVENQRKFLLDPDSPGSEKQAAQRAEFVGQEYVKTVISSRLPDDE